MLLLTVYPVDCSNELNESMTNDTHIDAAVVVLSSDGYSDFWSIFFNFFEKHSGLTALPLYLLSEEKSHDYNHLQMINLPHLVGESWSTRISDGLNAIDHEYVVLFTEDLLCTRPFSLGDWERLAQFTLAHDATCIRLAPMPPPSFRSKDVFSVLDSHALHRVSLQPSLWKRSSLLNLMVKGETPWEFEVNGSRRSRSDSAFFCANEPLLGYLEVIGRGLVTRKGAKLIFDAGLGSHLTRPLYSPIEEIRRNLSHMKTSAFYRLPSYIQNFLIRQGLVGRAFHD